ncbi:CD276 antigen-like [Poeciliopsis prolifica]|uniref:CD276 antigen-like n=1 Tax=Poeciliopsis prolifica TaxID=188132 RepID=UPI002414529B|nr:CD276 antigen-like [Poeciliopsis prolifica]
MKMFLQVLLVFLISQISGTNQDEVKVVGHDPIHAKVGDDVILPCHLEPPFDVNKLTIEWKLKGQKIHVHHSRAKDNEISDPEYHDRTFMFPDEFEKGNISLKLTKVTEEDEGNYICFVPSLERQVRKGNVTLILDKNGSQSNLTDTRGTDPGVIVGIIGALVGVVGLAALIFITYCVLRCRRREQIAEKMSTQEMKLK